MRRRSGISTTARWWSSRRRRSRSVPRSRSWCGTSSRRRPGGWSSRICSSRSRRRCCVAAASLRCSSGSLGTVEGAVAIVLAAGGGERLGLPIPKAFVELGGRTMLAHAAAAALACPGIAALVVVVPAGWEQAADEHLHLVGRHTVVAGGGTRQASVRAALDVAPSAAPVIVCHDAARPFASAALFGAVLSGLDGVHGVIPVVPLADTV